MAGKTRTVHDSMGSLQVPADALYGAQTQRALQNFPISGIPLPWAFIRALIMLKAAAARANQELAMLDAGKAQSIIGAAENLLSNPRRDQFPVDIFQTGSGTSTNMNVNEVLANLASSTGLKIHPNDDVNLGQSSNDMIPSSLHVSAVLMLNETLLPALDALHETINYKGQTLASVVKTGRTHLMDAVPMTMEQELSGWASQVRDCQERLLDTRQRLRRIAAGGTAIGTGINAHPAFSHTLCRFLNEQIREQFAPKDNLFSAIAAQDTAVELQGQLKVLACAMMKIANDLRWMNSGPLAGLSEIELEALQPGSSIMPGKVNPVLPEAVTMVAAQVMGFDTAVTIAGQSGNFQLNVMLPLIAYNVLTSMELLAQAARQLSRQIKTFRVSGDALAGPLARNPVLVTALTPLLGYERAAAIARYAYDEGRPVLEVAMEMSGLDEAVLRTILDPESLAHPHSRADVKATR